MKKQQLKYSFKDVLTIAISWLFALAVLYIIYIKIKTF
ncbi:flagellar biosynthesis/type III secretory pathway M-ring protein FliF/YscJ [Mucilaginibacter gotjawali]|uniref:Flagellar biosynthesis/type III secretory pathway M-ring protein FliF/YscJ n=1 Tax=Mucilaginibacter gotjawali TaxID=1550579 RepID=A0A839SIU9_9SPHI|nr:flagellar biosynthesis/type III secretory pathway M-ring protein FliF/YscJ [Mucilaginibacter gotjawali]